jgi:2'-5' RNA ligase
MFDEFWMMYPRKVAKAVARKAWFKLSEDQQLLAAQAINNHCEYWKAKETELEFIPHCATWLNGERYFDEIIIEPKKEKIDKKWMFSNEGIEAKARELGIIGNGYDTYQTLKAKCMSKLNMSVE